jgi:hypothetical protein
MTSLSPPNIFEGAVDLGHLGALIGTSTRLPYPLQPLTNATYNPYFYKFTLDVDDAFFGLLQSGVTVELYNFSRQLLATGGDIQKKPLSSGTYFIKVTNATAGEEMGLFAYRAKLDDPDGNDQAKAVNLGTWSSTDFAQRSNQQLGLVYNRLYDSHGSGSFTVESNERIIDDTVDWYKFTLTNTETIDFTASGRYGGFVLTGQVSGNLGATVTTMLSSGQRLTLQAGTYYLEVFDSQTTVSVGGQNQVITFRQDKETVDSYSFTLQHYFPAPPIDPGPSDNGDGNLVSAGNGHSYQYISFHGAARTWDEANAMATAMGGYLVTIRSQAENNFITNNVIPGHLTAGLSGAFIGSTDAGHEGLWVWATGPEAGTAFSNGPGSINGQYTNWAAGEPNGGTAENYGLIGADGQWLDVAAVRNAAFTTGFIIEYGFTTADMILRNNTNGVLEIYNLGRNAILAAAQLGQVGLDWQFSGIGNFSGRGECDMLLRNSNTGGLEVYDIANNQITNAAFIGTIGLDWQFSGVGNFSGVPGETDLILRNNRTGGLEVYDINNNQITGAAFMGAVGLNWQFSGIGNFSGRGESDMILRNSNTGGLEVYDIANNQLTGAAFIGTIGLDWQFSGVGNFSGIPGESDLILRNNRTGGLEVYNINNNQLTGAAFIGTVGLDWQFAGVAPVSGAGRSDLVLRNVNTGAFEVYDITNNQITGAALLGTVGLDWQLGGFAADPPTGSMGGSGSTSQLVQAMAGFGGGSGAAESLNTGPLSAETSQQTFLTTPQHA